MLKDQGFEEKIKKPEYRHLVRKTKGRRKYEYAAFMGGATSKHPSIQPSGITQEKMGGRCCIVLTMKTGSTYEGSINEQGERDGYGIYRVIFAGRYEGQWKDGFKHGKGKSYSKDGYLQYEGKWQGGEPHGYGIVFAKNGNELFKGEWTDGKSAENKYLKDYVDRINQLFFFALLPRIYRIL